MTPVILGGKMRTLLMRPQLQQPPLIDSLACVYACSLVLPAAATGSRRACAALLELAKLNASSSRAERASLPGARSKPKEYTETNLLQDLDKLLISDTRRPESSSRAKAKPLPAVPESVLVKELIFAAQGIEGTFLKLKEDGIGFVLKGAAVSPPLKQLVEHISRAGWMYRRVHAFIQRTANRASVGRVGQALCRGLEDELVDYYRLLAVLEAQQQEDAAAAMAPTPPPIPKLSIRGLRLYLEEPSFRLQRLATVTDSIGGLRGGALASAVAAFARHGDASMSELISRLMHRAFEPMFEAIRQWICEGELSDPFDEFFIGESADDRLWQDKYILRLFMLPIFLGAKEAGGATQ
ncbi:GCP3 [Symbiodinium sp. KB8]|nr:GCP3 [Symbiodinium sp. KB8]